MNLCLFRTDVAQFFQPSIDCIVKAVLEQRNSAHKTVSVSVYTSFFKYRLPNYTVFRSDIAQFFQPSIDCIVKAILEQKNGAHKTISVSFYSLYSTFYKYCFPTIFFIFSMSCWWAGLPPATGYSPKYMNCLLPLD